jgi:hypothetical protein
MFEKLNGLNDIPALKSIVEANLAIVDLNPGNMEVAIGEIPKAQNCYALAALPDSASRIAFAVLFEKSQAEKVPENYNWEEKALMLLSHLAMDFSEDQVDRTVQGFFHDQDIFWDTLVGLKKDFSSLNIITENYGSIHLIFKNSILQGTLHTGLLLSDQGSYDLSHVRLPFLDLFIPKTFPYKDKPVYVEHSLFIIDKPPAELPAFCIINKDTFTTYIGGRYTDKGIGVEFFKYMGSFLLRMYKKFTFNVKLAKSCEKFTPNQIHFGFKLNLVESNGVSEQIILYIPLNLALYLGRGVLPGMNINPPSWNAVRMTSLVLHLSTVAKLPIMKASTNEFLKSPISTHFHQSPIFRYFIQTVSYAESRRFLQKLHSFLSAEKIFQAYCCFFHRKSYDAEQGSEVDFLLISVSDFQFLTEYVFSETAPGTSKAQEFIDGLKTQLEESAENLSRIKVENENSGVQSNLEVMKFIYKQLSEDKIELSETAADYLNWFYYDIPEKKNKLAFDQILKKGHIVALEESHPGMLKEYFKSKGLMSEDIMQLLVFIHTNEQISNLLQNIIPKSRFAEFLKELEYQQSLIENKKASYSNAIQAFESFKEFATESI